MRQGRAKHFWGCSGLSLAYRPRLCCKCFVHDVSGEAKFCGDGPLAVCELCQQLPDTFDKQGRGRHVQQGHAPRPGRDSDTDKGRGIALKIIDGAKPFLLLFLL